MSLILFEADLYDPTVSGIRTVRAGSSDYNHPSAPGFYRGAIVADATARVSRGVWSAEGEYGAGKLDIAEIPIANVDGWLDWIVTNGCGFGFQARMLLLPSASSPYPAAVVVGTGVTEGAGHLWDRVTFRWRDPVAFLLDKAAQAAKFGGTNVLPDGVDGVEDLKGRWQPEWWGTNYNVSPPCVNTVKLVYQLSRRRMADVSSVFKSYDRGGILAKGLQRSTLSALMSTTPLSGGWDWYTGNEGTFIRLAGTPLGAITVDGCEGATAADRTIGQIWKRMLVDWGISNASAADAVAADGKQPGEIGIWLGTDDVQRRDTLNRVLASGGFVTWVDPANIWRLARAEAPAGSPVASFKVFRPGQPARASDGDILEWEWLNPGDGTANPVYSVDLTHGRNNTVQSKDALVGVALAPSSTSRGLQWLSEEWRHTVSADPSIQAAFPLARQTEEETLFVDPAVAAAEALRRRDMRKRGGPRWARLKVKFGPATAAAVDLMTVVSVTLPRWGMQAGRLALVRQIDPDWATQTADLYLYL